MVGSHLDPASVRREDRQAAGALALPSTRSLSRAVERELPPTKSVSTVTSKGVGGGGAVGFRRRRGPPSRPEAPAPRRRRGRRPSTAPGAWRPAHEHLPADRAAEDAERFPIDGAVLGGVLNEVERRSRRVYRQPGPCLHAGCDHLTCRAPKARPSGPSSFLRREFVFSGRGRRAGACCGCGS